jgi:hypothetical protein
MIKYSYLLEYKEDFKEVVLDLNHDNRLKNGYLISESLGSDIFSDFKSIKEEVGSYLKVIMDDTLTCGSGGNVNIIKANKEYRSIH